MCCIKPYTHTELHKTEGTPMSEPQAQPDDVRKLVRNSYRDTIYEELAQKNFTGEPSLHIHQRRCMAHRSIFERSMPHRRLGPMRVG